MSQTYFVTSFYFFKALDPRTEVPSIQAALETQGERLDLQGLLILGPEGLNATCSSTSRENLEAFKSWVRETFSQPDLLFKDSESDVRPFLKFKIKLRPEICTLRAQGLSPSSPKNNHLTPEEWHQALTGPTPPVVIDTRNDYEYRIGSFKGALNPNIEQFSDFPSFMKEKGLKKDEQIFIFCTGGIRCEKVIVELQNDGFENIHQLEGGILKYLEKFPNGQFEGECFVFDNRVAVDQNLKPTRKYKLCPHCGQPAEVRIQCIRCDTETSICPNCARQAVIGETCSKNCAHHHRLQPGKKGRRQLRLWESRRARAMAKKTAKEAPRVSE